MKLTLKCRDCGGEFRHNNKRKLLCPECVRSKRQQVDRAAWERLKFARDSAGRAKEYRANTSEMLAVERLSRQAVAERLNMTYGAVKKAERVALVQIRQDPELKKLVAFWIEEGCPVGTLRMTPADVERNILNKQLEVADYWRFYEKLVRANCREEALQVLKEIRGCQVVIRKAVDGL